MALSDLDANDKKVYEYLKLYDFVENPWSTKKAAKALKMKEDDVYESLSNFCPSTAMIRSDGIFIFDNISVISLNLCFDLSRLIHRILSI